MPVNLAGNLLSLQQFTLLSARSSWDEDAVGVFADAFEFSSRFIWECGVDESFEFGWRFVAGGVSDGVADGAPGDSESGAKFGFAKAILEGAEEVGDLVGVVGDDGADGGDDLHDEEDGENF